MGFLIHTLKNTFEKIKHQANIFQIQVWTKNEKYIAIKPKPEKQETAW
jgi:molybdopterin synthase catalytic subunit